MAEDSKAQERTSLVHFIQPRGNEVRPWTYFWLRGVLVTLCPMVCDLWLVYTSPENRTDHYLWITSKTLPMWAKFLISRQSFLFYLWVEVFPLNLWLLHTPFTGIGKEKVISRIDHKGVILYVRSISWERRFHSRHYISSAFSIFKKVLCSQAELSDQKIEGNYLI